MSLPPRLRSRPSPFLPPSSSEARDIQAAMRLSMVNARASTKTQNKRKTNLDSHVDSFPILCPHPYSIDHDSLREHVSVCDNRTISNSVCLSMRTGHCILPFCPLVELEGREWEIPMEGIRKAREKSEGMGGCKIKWKKKREDKQMEVTGTYQVGGQRDALGNNVYEMNVKSKNELHVERSESENNDGFKPFDEGFQVPKVAFDTRCINLGKTQEGAEFEDGMVFEWDAFRKHAMDFKSKYLDTHKTVVDEVKSIEKEFWRIVELSQEEKVYYGADLPTTTVGSCFEANHPWNLCKLPEARGGILRYLDSAISGISQPWLYIGTMFSPFCIHVEDEYLPSINYNHGGAVKVWYVISASQADAVEKAIKLLRPKFSKSELFNLTALVSPAELMSMGITVTTLHQYPGEFVITWPRAYHFGFNCGFNVAEAVNIGYEEWFPFGRIAATKYRLFAREATFCYQHLLLSVALNSKKEDIDKAVIEREPIQLEKDDSSVKNAAIEYGLPMEYMPMVERQSPKFIPQCHTCKRFLFIHYFACADHACKRYVFCVSDWRQGSSYICNHGKWRCFYRFSSKDWECIILKCKEIQDTISDWDVRLMCPKFQKSAAPKPKLKYSRMTEHFKPTVSIDSVLPIKRCASDLSTESASL